MIITDELTRDVLAMLVTESYQLTFDMDPTDETNQIRRKLRSMRDILMSPNGFSSYPELTEEYLFAVINELEENNGKQVQG